MSKILAFTGLRPQKLRFGFNEAHPDCIALKAKMKAIIIDLIEKEDVCLFISGLAIGVDTYAADIVIELKGIYPHIRFEAAIPCLSQERKWPLKTKERYYAILKQCDEHHYCTEKEYEYGCMDIRNKYMVDKADIIFSVWDGQKGGTASTVAYAREKKKGLFILDPYSLKMTCE